MTGMIFPTTPTTPVTTVTKVSQTASSNLIGLGYTATFTVDFSDAVTVTGVPTLLLDDGGTATYVGGSGTDSLVFSYTAGTGQDTPDLNAVNASLNGGTITDTNGNSVASAFTGIDGVQTIATFDGTNGGAPRGGLIDVGGNLYGASADNIYEIANGTSSISVLATFTSAVAQLPSGPLVVDANGDLFGVAETGGAYDDGSVFELAKNSNSVSLIASFNLTNGALPYGGLLIDKSGNLWGTTKSGGTGNTQNTEGTIFEIKAGTSSISVVVNFNGTNGSNPESGLIQDSAGNFYGVAYTGGPTSNQYGTIFELGANSTSITTLYSFTGNGQGQSEEPNSTLIMDAAGNLYGTATQGGLYNEGTVFELAKGTTSATILASFDSTTVGGGPNINTLVMDSAGNLFGTTTYGGSGSNNGGTVFEVVKNSYSISLIADLPAFQYSNNDYTAITLTPTGQLYGVQETTAGNPNGSIFTVNTNTSGIAVDTTPLLATLIDIVPTPATLREPQSAVLTVQFNKTVYVSGGIPTLSLNNGGTATYVSGTGTKDLVFDYTIGPNQLTPALSVTSLNLNGSTIQDAAGNLANATEATTIPTGEFSLAAFNNANSVGTGMNNQSPLYMDAGGNLYGENLQLGGNPSATGTVFEVAKNSGSVTVLFNFDTTTTGTEPYGGLVADSAGNLYGVVQGGLNTPNGAVFEIAIGTSTDTIMSSFNSTTGETPLGGVIIDSAGNLFGTTSASGTGSAGSVYEIANGTTSITVLASFTTANGGGASGSLYEDANGNLYGTTSTGGSAGDGTVYELANGTGSITVLGSFTGTNGKTPLGGLVADSAGNFYGTTSAGGANSDGTIFEIAKNSNSITTLVNFNGADGSAPLAGTLVIDAAGDLFGTTSTGGTQGAGEVFELVKGATDVSILHAFNYLSGGTDPAGGLVADSAGNLYGALAGYSGAGIYEIGNNITDLNNITAVVCFAEGTHIRTDRGNVVVEHLTVGDLVATAFGGFKPITWLGHRHINCDRHPQPEHCWPVRVSAHAFGENLPERDLYISPEHAVWHDGVLIPISELINGTSITQIRRQSVNYWHVELAAHDVILAEGLPAESYLENGNRDWFEDSPAMQLHPMFVHAANDFATPCAPIIRQGVKLETARAMLSAHAAKIAA